MMSQKDQSCFSPCRFAGRIALLGLFAQFIFQEEFTFESKDDKGKLHKSFHVSSTYFLSVKLKWHSRDNTTILMHRNVVEKNDGGRGDRRRGGLQATKTRSQLKPPFFG